MYIIKCFIRVFDKYNSNDVKILEMPAKYFIYNWLVMYAFLTFKTVGNWHGPYFTFHLTMKVFPFYLNVPSSPSPLLWF